MRVEMSGPGERQNSGFHTDWTLSVTLAHIHWHGMCPTLRAALVGNPFCFFCALRSHFVVHNESMGCCQFWLRGSEVRVQCCKCHRVYTSTYSEACSDCQDAHYKCSRLASPSLSKLDAPWLSTPIHCPKTLSKASRNSSFVIGKLVCELYHLVLRHAAAEEHFLNLRTLLLHINDAVALNNKHREAREREKQQIG